MTKPAVPPRAPVVEHIALEHGAVRAMRAGAGRPLLLLHGGAGAGPWNSFYGRLADDNDVLIPDHPGFGRSDDFPDVAGIDGLVEHYLELIDRAGLDRPILVGVSFGGWIAAELASRVPDVTDVLVLMASVGLEIPGAPITDIFAVPPQELAPRLFHDPGFAQRLPAPTAEAARTAARNRAALERFARTPLLHDARLDARLDHVTARTAVFWPESDRVVPRAVAERFADRIPGAAFQVLRGYGHALYVERPEPLGDVVAAAIERLSAG